MGQRFHVVSDAVQLFHIAENALFYREALLFIGNDSRLLGMYHILYGNRTTISYWIR
jgi:hypothetical protein